MNPTFLNDLQLDAGFYPLASLLTGAVLYALYRLFVRMRCRSRQAQAFLTFGICLMTASLFFRLTVWTDAPAAATAVETGKADAALTTTAGSAGAESGPGFTERFLDAIAVAWDYTCSHSSLVYAAGFALLFLFMAVQLLQLGRIRRKSMPDSRRGAIRVFQSPYDVPFSFGYNIFLPGSIEGRQRDFVLAHEESHIWHRHFHKLLILQCLTIVNWFNPFAYLIFRAIKELQEMEVDRDVIDNGFDREQYQINLVLTCTEHKEWIWTQSNYNYSSLKERILFMNKSIKGFRSGVLVFAAGFCFAALLGLIGMQTLPRPAQAATTGPDAAGPESINPLNKEIFNAPLTARRFVPLRGYNARGGCWYRHFSGDSAYLHDKRPTFSDYKFFGHSATLTVSLRGRGQEVGGMTIEGATANYIQLSDTLAWEGGNFRLRRWADSRHFDDTWKDVHQLVPFIPSQWKTETWERITPPEHVKSIFRPCRECLERDDRLKGVWKQETNKGTLYNFFGKDRYVYLRFTPVDPENLSYTLWGSCAEFWNHGDSIISKFFLGLRIHWIDENSFQSVNIDTGQPAGIYTRVEMPDFFRKILEGSGLW